VVFEGIGKLLVRIVVEIIFEGIILGTLNFLNKGLNFIWCKVTGKKKSENKPNPKAQLKKQLLYEKIELTENLNSSIRKGQHGVVLEIIDKDTVFAEFYDYNKRPIEVDNKLIFIVGIKQFR
jgi:hypothetical protein